ncbi:MAG TPA: alpha/beta hydrolase [Reyranella sp.]|nr:alpha/beta hydrolase [Reyranella sp.]
MTSDETPDDVIRLWPDGPPSTPASVGPEIEFRTPVSATREARMLRNVSEPTLAVFRPTKANGVGVIVCPGGGWRSLSMEHEGVDVVRWLTALGYTAFLLKYRLCATPAAQADYDAELVAMHSHIELRRRGRDAYRLMSDIVPDSAIAAAREVANDDGRRALAIVRERAEEWGLDAAKIGMIGFSAGGFLAADVALDPRGAPLAFVATLYGGETRGRPVPANAPPLFAVVAQDDWLLYRLVEGLYSDWTDAGRPAELHIFRRGNHGFGVMKQGLPSDRWSELFHHWLADQGLG